MTVSLIGAIRNQKKGAARSTITVWGRAGRARVGNGSWVSCPDPRRELTVSERGSLRVIHREYSSQDARMRSDQTPVSVEGLSNRYLS